MFSPISALNNNNSTYGGGYRLRSTTLSKNQLKSKTTGGDNGTTDKPSTDKNYSVTTSGYRRLGSYSTDGAGKLKLLYLLNF